MSQERKDEEVKNVQKETYEIEYNHGTRMYEILTIATGRFIAHFYSWIEADKHVLNVLGGY